VLFCAWSVGVPPQIVGPSFFAGLEDFVGLGEVLPADDVAAPDVAGVPGDDVTCGVRVAEDAELDVLVDVDPTWPGVARDEGETAVPTDAPLRCVV